VINNFSGAGGLYMTKQLSFSFEDKRQMRVIGTISEETKQEAIYALKEVVTAYVELKSTGGVKNGERSSQ
jgi:hypothetical protein